VHFVALALLFSAMRNWLLLIQLCLWRSLGSSICTQHSSGRYGPRALAARSVGRSILAFLVLVVEDDHRDLHCQFA
jgi:hypothetical protein